MKIQHILLTTDLSPESLHPCQPVGDFARMVGARITLLHIVEELRVAPHGAPLAPPISPVDSEKRVSHAEMALEEQRAALGEGIEIKTEVLVAEKIAPAVNQYAEKNGIDLVCLSTHGRTGFRHLALGSVAEAIIRHATIPVLTFPQPK